MTSKYESLGASAGKAGLHAVLDAVGLHSSRRYFSGINTDLAGDSEYVSFIHCDGAGTKALVAYLQYRESGSPTAFRGLSQDALVMNLDDLYCLGNPASLLLGNLVGRNPRLVKDEALSEIIAGYKEQVEQLRALGIPIELGGGETADLGDVVRTLLVDAVISGRIKRGNLIDASRIAPGDLIVGLSSTGQTTYESRPNSGVASNGLTLARHALLKAEYRERYPEISDPQADAARAYSGQFELSAMPAGLGMSVGEALLSPTRTYAPVLREIYGALGESIHGAVHLTGGALTKVLRFGGPGLRFVKDKLFPTPPLFSLIQQEADVPWREMYQVFNMGQRFELYLAREAADTAIQIAARFALEARVIGHVEKYGVSDANEVHVKSEAGAFDYRL